MESENLEEPVNLKDYWKCQQCGQVVEIEFDICWNCQNGKTEEIENPFFDELLNYKSNDQNRLNPLKFLRCPKCGETGVSKIGACWNCGNIPI